MRVAALALVAGLFATPSLSAPAQGADQLVVWAWERPEDLRFLPPEVEIAALSGFIELHGDRLTARGRRFPLRARMDQITTSVVHVQIARGAPLQWTPRLRANTADAVIALAHHIPARRLQIDFEVRASQRQVLLDLVSDVRRALAPGEILSITALASWCDSESWTANAGADEIVPMLFRMGPWGAAIRQKLAFGGDFSEPECRSALAISEDSPLARAPLGRRIYLFDARSWSIHDFERMRGEIEEWRARHGGARSPRG